MIICRNQIAAAVFAAFVAVSGGCGRSDAVKIDNGSNDASVHELPVTDLTGEDLTVTDRAVADLTFEDLPTIDVPSVDPQLAPRYIHMTFNGNPQDSVAIQWETPEKILDSYIPKVLLVKASDVPDADPSAFEADVRLPLESAIVVEGAGHPYCPLLVCDETTVEGTLWSVDVTGLAPDTEYYYRVGAWVEFDALTGVMTDATVSPVYHFKTGLPKGARDKLQFGFGGDSQIPVDDFTDKLIQLRSNHGLANSFWLIGGDVAEHGLAEELSTWFEDMSPILHYYPVMLTRGNHDKILTAFFGRFSLPQMPGLADDLKKGAWSFNYGNIHVAGIDANTTDLVASQLAWLQQDLAEASTDPDIDWKIVVFHETVYSSSYHGSTLYMQELVVPVLDQYGVDLVLNGHDHDYERTLSLKGGAVSSSGDGTVYVTSGAFFSKKYHENGQSWFTAVSVPGDLKNYVIVSVEGNTLIEVAYNGVGEVIDTFTLVK